MLLFIVCLLCLSVSAQNNTDANINDIDKNSQSSINIDVVEHEPSNIISNDSDKLSWQTTTERTLIRVTRLNDATVPSKVAKRSRRQILEAIQTAGVVIHVAKAIHNTESMAKKVAIAVIVISSLCAVCCLITTVVVCVKCCCGGGNRKRSKGPVPVQVPQPVYVHTSPSQGWNSMPIQSSESRPMLPPQPSAPPRPYDHFHMEHPPPPYEKLYNGK